MPKARTRRAVVLSKNGQNPAYAGAWIETDRVALRYALTPALPARPDDVDEQHALLRRCVSSGPTLRRATGVSMHLASERTDGLHSLGFVGPPRRV